MKWLRRWGWDYKNLRDAIMHAHRVELHGKKYELYLHKKGYKKIIVVYDGRILCITGSQGGRK